MAANEGSSSTYAHKLSMINANYFLIVNFVKFLIANFFEVSCIMSQHIVGTSIDNHACHKLTD